MLHDVNDPAYWVKISHNPADGSAVCYTARVYTPGAEDEPLHVTYGSSRQAALEHALEWVKGSLQRPEPTSTVVLDGAGEVIARHDG